MSDTCFLALECTEEENQVFQQIAREKRMELSEWIVGVLRTYVPTNKWADITRTEPAPLPMEAAYTQLDRNDREIGLQAPIELKQIELKVTPAAREPIKPVQDMVFHPCTYLKAGEFPYPHDAKSCQGTCTAQARGGNAPCFVGAGNARNCMYFAPRFRNAPRHFNS